MDFSAQLANLQKTASAAQRGNDRNNNRDPNGSGGARRSSPSSTDDRRRPPRSYNNNNNRSGRGDGRDNSYYGNSNEHDQKRQRIDGPYRNPKWNNMKRIVDSLPPYKPPPPPESSSSSSSSSSPPSIHLCLLAITIHDLPFEAIWRDWASRQTNNNVTISLIAHAKQPHRVESDWLKQRLLVEPPRMGRGNDYAPPTYHSRRPAWGSIEITRAMLDLCHESCNIGTDHDMKDERFATRRYRVLSDDNKSTTTTTTTTTMLPKVDKVLFISETCLPVASLTPELLSSPASIVNARDTPNNGFSRQLQFDKIHSLVPVKFKADQWMMLSRPHVDAILTMLPRNFWECFVDCNASDELYFPTALALLRVDELDTRRITYADWSVGPKNPATFETKEELKKVVKEARKEGCLVARKFVGIDLVDWKAVVYPDE